MEMALYVEKGYDRVWTNLNSSGWNGKLGIRQGRSLLMCSQNWGHYQDTWEPCQLKNIMVQYKRWTQQWIEDM